METLLQDSRYSVRMLAKAPGFAIIAVVVIAVGIGVNTAVFSVIDAVLLKPLTYPNPQELVSLVNTSPQGTFPGASIPKFSLWHGQTSIFQQLSC
jgi:putative ABC transport system permease protein